MFIPSNGSLHLTKTFYPRKNQTIMGKLQITFLISLLELGITVQAQTSIIKGKVVSEKGTVAGASVLIKGSTNGTETDNDGNFTLNIPTAKTTVIVSFVGFEEMKYMVNAGD